MGGGRIGRRMVGVAAACSAMSLVGLGLSATMPAASAAAASLPAVSPGRVTTFLNHFDSTTLDVATEAPKRRVIALNAWDYPYIPAIKAANPATLVLVYKDLSSTRDFSCHNGVDDAELPTGVGCS